MRRISHFLHTGGTMLRKQLMLALLGVSLFASEALAFPAGWWQQIAADGKHDWSYDDIGRLRREGWIDANGNFHEKTYGIANPGGGGIFADTGLNGPMLSVTLNAPVASLAIYDMRSGQEAVRSGPAQPGQSISLPVAGLGNGVQMLAALDADGRALEVFFFKKPGACDGGSWISR
jgi:hypothetical protein